MILTTSYWWIMSKCWWRFLLHYGKHCWLLHQIWVCFASIQLKFSVMWFVSVHPKWMIGVKNSMRFCVWWCKLCTPMIHVGGGCICIKAWHDSDWSAQTKWETNETIFQFNAMILWIYFVISCRIDCAEPPKRLY